MPPAVEVQSLNHPCSLFDNSYSDKGEVVPHCGFDLHFSDN